MSERRGGRRDLADGPAKLCQAFAIGPAHNGADLCGAADIGLFDDGTPPPSEPVVGPRIGISKAVDVPWRWRVSTDVETAWRFAAAAWHHRRRHGPDRRPERAWPHPRLDRPGVPPVAPRRALGRRLRRVRSHRRFAARRSPARPARSAPLPDGRPPPVPARRRRHRHDRRPGRQVGGAQPAQPRRARLQRRRASSSSCSGSSTSSPARTRRRSSTTPTGPPARACSTSCATSASTSRSTR